MGDYTNTTTDTPVTLSELAVGDRITVIVGKAGYRPYQVTGAVTSLDYSTLGVQMDSDRGTALATGCPTRYITSITRKATPPVCTGYAGTGPRCTACRYRRDMH